jgi:mono/diheme cytochrome c family protein
MNKRQRLMRWLTFWGLCTLILLVTGCSLNNEQVATKQVNNESSIEIDETRIKVLLPSCMSCHGVDLGGVPGDGPSLKNIGVRYAKEEIIDILKNGRNNGRMPKGLLEGGQAKEGDLEMLAEWLSTFK